MKASIASVGLSQWLDVLCLVTVVRVCDVKQETGLGGQTI